MFRRIPKSKLKTKLENNFLSDEAIARFRREGQSQVPMACGCILMSLGFVMRDMASRSTSEIKSANPDIAAFFFAHFIFCEYRRYIVEKIRLRELEVERALEYKEFISISSNLLITVYKNEYNIRDEFSQNLLNRYRDEGSQTKLLEDLKQIPKGASDFGYAPDKLKSEFVRDLASVQSFSVEMIPAFIEKMMNLSKLVGWDPVLYLWPRRT